MCQGKEATRHRCLLTSCGEELKAKDFSNHEIKLPPSQAGKTGFSTLLADRPNRYHLNEIRFVFPVNVGIHSAIVVSIGSRIIFLRFNGLSIKIKEV